LQKVKELLGSDQANEFALGDDGMLRFRGRICVPGDAEVRRLIVEEGHKSRLSLHSGISRPQENLLVARYEEGRCLVCICHFDLSKGEGETSETR